MNKEYYTKYDNECIVYLSLEILKMLDKEKEHIYIDLYYEEITKIYEDYKKEDDSNVSLLESINNYIYKHKQELLNRIDKAFEGAF